MISPIIPEVDFENDEDNAHVNEGDSGLLELTLIDDETILEGIKTFDPMFEEFYLDHLSDTPSKFYKTRDNCEKLTIEDFYGEDEET